MQFFGTKSSESMKLLFFLFLLKKKEKE